MEIVYLITQNVGYTTMDGTFVERVSPIGVRRDRRTAVREVAARNFMNYNQFGINEFELEEIELV